MRAHHVLLGVTAAGIALLAVVACNNSDSHLGGGANAGYIVSKLVSDIAGTAKYAGENTPAGNVDPNLKNPWGIAFNPAGFVWVANNHTNTATLYDGSGAKQSLTVTLPEGTDPTGIVYNGAAADFGGSIFIFDGEGGTVASWSGGSTAATRFTTADGAVYKGLAIASNGTANFLYAADFHNARIDVFSNAFVLQAAAAFPFTDPAPPLAGYSPFGIQAIGGLIYVTYASKAPGADDETVGAGLGYVDVYDANGGFVSHFTAGGALNAPWGVAKAPPDFGTYSGDILVGNFGDGVINAFDPNNGQFIGSIKDGNGQAIALSGLWGIAFGNGLNNQPANALFFAAGTNDEANGLYGRIDCGC